MFLSWENLLEKLEEIIDKENTFQDEKSEREEFEEVIKKKEEKKLKKFLSPVSYELKVGREAFLSGKNERINIKEQGYVVIEPGMFASILTYEYITIPEDLIGFISLKFGLKSKGLVNVSGFHVDPGFKGHLVFTVFNLGPHPIILRYKEQAFLLFLAKLTAKAKCKYKGKHQEQKEISPEIISWLTGEKLNFVQFESKISSLEAKVNILIGTGITLLIGLLGIILKFLFK